MKKYLSALALAAVFFPGTEICGQWQVRGGNTYVKSGSFFFAEGDVEVSAGTFTNLGTINCQDLSNTANLRGTGTWKLGGDFDNTGSHTQNSKFELVGPTPAMLNTDDPIYSLTLNKDAGATEVELATSLTVTNVFKLVGANNKLLLGDHDFQLNAGTVGTPSATKYLVTNGLGMFRRPNLGTTLFTFPVGATTTSYNPIQIANTGTADEIGVRVLPDALDGGGSGSPIAADGVAASWEISEGTPGGSSLNVTAQWLLADELPGFTRASCSVRWWNGSAWDFSPLGAATGAGTATNPYKRVRNGLTDVGFFAVLDGGFPMAKPAFSELRNEDGETIGMEQNLPSFEFQILPNPFDNQLVIAARELTTFQKLSILKVRIFDAVGRFTVEQNFPAGSESIQLETQNFLPGVYQVQILDSEGRVLQVLRAVK